MSTSRQSESEVVGGLAAGWPFDAEEAKRRQAEAASATAKPITRSVQLSGAVRFDFVLIPPGQFLMGSPNTERYRRADEQQHVICLTRAFYMGKYPITQAQWEGMVGANDNPSGRKGAEHPVEKVRWDDIQQKFLPKIQVHASEGELFRLPTEAEWEYACRGGTQTPYSTGDVLSKGSACIGTGVVSSLAGMFTGAGTKPVGSYAPNAWGLHDMHGNVWEWCQDFYAADLSVAGPATDPCNTLNSKDRVVRGDGYAYYGAGYGRSARRRPFPGIIRVDRCDDLGFRVVLASG